MLQPIIRVVTGIVLGLSVACSVNRSGEVATHSSVIDKSNLLSLQQEDSVSWIIEGLKADVGSQMTVLIVDSLGSKKLEEFSLQTADSLKLGRPLYDDGLLITIVVAERKVRIEVGTGLENIIKDEIAAAIIREDMAPRFRSGNYGQGIYLAVTRIARLIRDNKNLIGHS